MYLRRVRRGLAGLLCAAFLMTPAAAAQVEINGTVLSPDQGWVEDGVSFVTLRALSELTDYALDWDGAAARLVREDVELSARPGALYIEVNDRALYVPGGVQMQGGYTVLPLRLLEQALGGAVSWDGQSATASYDTTNARAKSADYPEEDLYWLSRVISAESRGESLTGQIAVGNVVLNRVADEQFPDTVREVVFDRKNGVQFEPLANGTLYDAPTHSSVIAAKLVLEGADAVGECLYFFAPQLSAGTWIVNNRNYYTTIGCHRFYL